MISMKKCYACKIAKEYNHFYKCKSMKDGYAGTCKECMKLYAQSDKCRKKRKSRDLQNRKNLNEYQRYYNKTHRELLNKIQKKYYYKYWNLNRKRINQYHNSDKRRGANNAKAAKRRAILAVCSFSNFKKEIRSIYEKCPEGFHVDHIVPLNSENVCGLHVPWNLQYLPALDNLKKSNKV